MSWNPVTAYLGSCSVGFDESNSTRVLGSTEDQVIDPLGRRPVIGQGDARLAAPVDVGERVAQMPGHDARHGKRSPARLRVVAQGRGEQFDPRAGTGEGAQVVLRFPDKNDLEVDDQPQPSVLPDLVVPVQIPAHQHGFVRLRENRVGPRDQRFSRGS